MKAISIISKNIKNFCIAEKIRLKPGICDKHSTLAINAGVMNTIQDNSQGIN